MAKRIQKRLTSFFSKINLTKQDETSVENILPESSQSSSQSSQSFHLELTSSQLSPPSSQSSSQESQSSLELPTPPIQTNKVRPQSSITITKINKNVDLSQHKSNPLQPPSLSNPPQSTSQSNRPQSPSQSNQPEPPSQSKQPEPPSQSNASLIRPIVCDELDPAILINFTITY
jgi:hypothetical protein